MQNTRVAIPVIARGACHRVHWNCMGSSGTGRRVLERLRTHESKYSPSNDRRPRFEQSIKDFDVNGDGYLCIKIIPNEGGPPQIDPAFLYLDNKI